MKIIWQSVCWLVPNNMLHSIGIFSKHFSNQNLYNTGRSALGSTRQGIEEKQRCVWRNAVGFIWRGNTLLHALQHIGNIISGCLCGSTTERSFPVNWWRVERPWPSQPRRVSWIRIQKKGNTKLVLTCWVPYLGIPMAEWGRAGLDAERPVHLWNIPALRPLENPRPDMWTSSQKHEQAKSYLNNCKTRLSVASGL